MQIDDEAFNYFKVQSVPTIVLSVPTTIFAKQSSLGKFDKASGSLTVKAALEMFADRGDLALDAKELLK